MRLARVCAVVSVLFVSACRPPHMIDSDTAFAMPGEKIDWLIALYVSADNELEYAALRDLNELESGLRHDPSVAVYCLLDRSPGHDKSDGNWTGARLLRMNPDPDGEDSHLCSTPLACPELGIGASGGPLDMSDPATLDGFVGSLRRLHDARHLALVLWGYSPAFHTLLQDDSSSGVGMALPELGSVVSKYHPQVLGLDSGFSACIETAYEFAHSADFLVAHQDLAVNGGWPYGAFVREFLESDRSPIAMCRAIVAAYRETHATHPLATVSAMSLPAVVPVHHALNTVSRLLHQSAAEPDIRDRLRRSLFYDVEDFYRTPGDLFLDLSDLASVASATISGLGDVALELEGAVSDAIVSHWAHPAGAPRASGLSVHYIPLDGSGIAAASHAPEYLRGSPNIDPLAFVSDSAWVPSVVDGTGLLFRLFYEVLR